MDWVGSLRDDHRRCQNEPSLLCVDVPHRTSAAEIHLSRTLGYITCRRILCKRGLFRLVLATEVAYRSETLNERGKEVRPRRETNTRQGLTGDRALIARGGMQGTTNPLSLCRPSWYEVTPLRCFCEPLPLRFYCLWHAMS